MAVNDLFTVTYGGFTVGGASDTYLLSGVQGVEITHDSFRFTFGVQVMATTPALMQANSDALEFAFSNRLTEGSTLVIDIDGTPWTYTHGSTILNTEAAISKPGNLETDTSRSRFYVITITGELPPKVGGGLRDIRADVQIEATKQAIVSIAGVYTATGSGDALANYTANADAECATLLVAVSNGTFELVDENYQIDRHKDSGGDSAPNLLSFTRTYTELLANQSTGVLDDPDIVDHRLTFQLNVASPGDARSDGSRLQEASAQFDCAVNKNRTTDLLTIIAEKIRPYVVSEFTREFPAVAFAVQNERSTTDRTNNRISVNFVFIFQSATSGGGLLTSSQAVEYREIRQIDYTPTHSDDELAMHADPGFVTLLRIWSRTIQSLDPQPPRRRITERTSGGDPFTDPIGGESGVDNRDGTQINPDGWNIIDSSSQASETIFGLDIDEDSFRIYTLTEVVTEQFHRRPTGRSSDPVDPGPVS